MTVFDLGIQISDKIRSGITWKRKFFPTHLLIQNENDFGVTLVGIIKYYNQTGLDSQSNPILIEEPLLKERGELSTGNPNVKIDTLTGMFIHKYVKPTGTTLKYDGEFLKPFDGTSFVDFEKDVNGEYVENPDFSALTNIYESDYFKSLTTTSTVINDLITQFVTNHNNLGRWN